MDDLTDFRKSLDQIDARLIELLAQRFEVCREVAKYKKLNKVPMMQPDRVKAVQERCAELAKSHSVSPDFAREMYALIIGEACRLEDEIIGRDSNRG